ncbi:hypothetical protein Q2T76_03530 [Lactobacillus sp. YT155]|uniref:hypothetical protein n=1 Tax=Lactobacillus sp. YT155 TaxID=3060955 RepID=UPI0026602033|nr:hypothetical protein [Lactobacillus sp. YT155]MDO1605124.1 hypothetical protein [Lactobacillus sp. YT155]
MKKIVLLILSTLVLIVAGCSGEKTTVYRSKSENITATTTLISTGDKVHKENQKVIVKFGKDVDEETRAQFISITRLNYTTGQIKESPKKFKAEKKYNYSETGLSFSDEYQGSTYSAKIKIDLDKINSKSLKKLDKGFKYYQEHSLKKMTRQLKKMGYKKIK